MTHPMKFCSSYTWCMAKKILKHGSCSFLDYAIEKFFIGKWNTSMSVTVKLDSDWLLLMNTDMDLDQIRDNKHLLNPDFNGSTSRREKVSPLGISLSALATSKCREPTILLSLIFSMWSPTHIPSILSIMLASFILLINAYPAPLSVMVRPRASSDLSISTTFGRPRMWAKIKSSSPIWPPRRRVMSTLCVFRVQNRIWNINKTIYAVNNGQSIKVLVRDNRHSGPPLNA